MAKKPSQATVLTDVQSADRIPVGRSGNSTATVLTASLLLSRANHTGMQDASTISQSANYRMVTDSQISTWNSGSGGDMQKNTYDPNNRQTDAFARANHTGTQTPATIATDSNNRFVTDAEKATWNAKQSALSGDVTGHYHSSDRSRSNHTGTQAATTIVDDSTHRFVTDAEKTQWNSNSLPTQTGNANKFLSTTGSAPEWRYPNYLQASNGSVWRAVEYQYEDGTYTLTFERMV